MGGADIITAIFKTPAERAVRVGTLGLEGDEQANQRAHGGTYKAVYAHAAEELRIIAEATGHHLGPGGVGENLTLEGVDVASAEVGERWRIGTATFQVTMPRSPCEKINLRTGDPHFREKFAALGLFGAYLKVVEEGELAPGAAVEIVRRPGHGATITTMAEAVSADGDIAGLLAAGGDLVPDLRALATRRLARRSG